MSSTKTYSPGTATFFTSTNFEGESLNFSSADGGINLQNANGEYYQYDDDFDSVELGENSKAYLWQYGGFAGKSQVLEESDLEVNQRPLYY